MQRADDLSGWLYARMEYVAADPVARIAVLMDCKKDAWRVIRTDEDYLAWLDLLVNQGYYQLYLGNILQSIQCYEQAYSFYKQVLPDPYDVEDHILKPLGNNYTRLGDYESALYIQEQMLSLALHKKDNSLIAAAYANMAVLRRSQGEWINATALAKLGLQYAGDKAPVRGLLLNTLADLATARGSYDSARQLNIAAIKLLRSTNPDVAYWLESAYVQAGQLAAATDNNRAAIQQYQLALQVIEHHFKGGRQRETANVYVLMGRALLEQNKPELAEQQYLQALKILLPRYRNTTQLPLEHWLYGEYILQDALEGLARTYHLLGNSQRALSVIDLCFAAAAKLRNEFAGMDSRRLQQQENRRRVELAMRIAYSLYKTSGQILYANRMLQYAEQGKAQWLLEEIRRNVGYAAMHDKDSLFHRMQQLEQAIAYSKREALNNADIISSMEYEMSGLQRKLQQRYPALLQSNRVTSTQLNDLPENTEVITCFAGEKQWFLLEADRQGVKVIRIIDSITDLQAQCRYFVQHYFKEGPGAMINDPHTYYKDAYKLYTTLLKNKQWQPTRQYLFLTDDVLGYVPFDALVTDSLYRADIGAWPFLVKQASISYAYSLLSWQQLRKRKDTGTKSFTGFFITHDSSSRAIPAVVEEQRQLKEIISGKYKENKAATLQSLEQALQQTGVLHISTHAGLYGVHHEPVLELTDGNFALSSLTARLHAPQLVVLSACRTADGWLMQGEGVQSLSWGFAAAGIPGVVAGLWNVNDAGAATFMPHFYANLREGQEVGMALHTAKIQWLQQQTSPVLQLPYYWSGWVYMGIPQTISLTAPTPVYWWIAGGAVVLLLIFFLFYSYKK
ncbi:CHAT domain-containing protein [Chitinophaga sp. CF118]|uniref:CHAT domain-containing protein n=1 Tax=Chitinophaga sp. CF118 TaxID=1884367 RepID=UPI000B7E2564|nr:CHAT domain-containing tetratricopeptide repeat protein [Chitinophaga sp. CF118]